MARTCLVLLLLVSSIFSAFGDGVFIDCGGSTFFTDEINSVVWMGDADFVGITGESEVVQTPRGVSTVMSTLRVFTSRSKNCYKIDTFTKGRRVLVRASFYYGNYDKKSAPPTFDLLFDGNYWESVQTSLDQIVYAEVSYVVMSNVTSICLAQSKANQFPFISALEVRGLGTKMYNLLDSSYALRTKDRFAYGATSPRYSDDDYGRIWKPVVDGSSSGSTIVENHANYVFIDLIAAPDKPPNSVFAAAITTPSTATPIILTTNFPLGETPVCVNLYFTEVTQLDTTQTRSFQVYGNDDPLVTPPIVPSYESVVEVNIVNVTATSGSSISLKSTSDSTLPPLVSAAEVFYINGPLNEGTDSYDVDGLHALQTGFVGTLDQWSGDPCLPSPYSWDWINCTSDPTPRVTELNLCSYGLSGLLPDFSSMDSLEIIDLHNNKISGPIPDFLGVFPNLKVLNLANNDFSGPIPASISNNTKLKLQVSGNPQLCDTGKSCPTHTDTTVDGSPDNGGSGGGRGKKKSKIPIVLGATIPAFFAFWAIVGTLYVIKKREVAVAAADGGASGPNDTPEAQAGQNNPSVGIVGEAVVETLYAKKKKRAAAAAGGASGPNDTPEAQAG